MEESIKPAAPFHEDPKSESEGAYEAILKPGDFYYEGAYLVFTAAYHLKRGYCCNSDCRHCPFK